MVNERAAMAKSAIVELQDGKSYRMDFDMAALANAEGVYEDKYGKIMGVDGIIGELVIGRARAMMALTYGAMMSAGEKITWEKFGKNIYTFENYGKISETVIDAISGMMGQAESAEENEKNADSRGAD